MARRKALSDNEAIALMVLHYGGNPVNDISSLLSEETRPKIKMLKTFWINVANRITTREFLLADRWFDTEGDAARAYCQYFELDG